MQLRSFIFVAAAIVGLGACQRAAEQTETPAAAESARAITDPAVVVRQIYDPYLVRDGNTPTLEQAAPWSARMAADIAAMRGRTEPGTAAPLDFDPVIAGQDYRLSDVATTTDSVVENSHAVVRASFTNIGQRQEVLYDLVWEEGRWKVDNIRGAIEGTAWDMREIVRSE
ncbi:MAG: DUF3828 domain-containing protein [Caulobacteraceae bacterium]